MAHRIEYQDEEEDDSSLHWAVAEYQEEDDSSSHWLVAEYQKKVVFNRLPGPISCHNSLSSFNFSAAFTRALLLRSFSVCTAYPILHCCRSMPLFLFWFFFLPKTEFAPAVL